MIFEDEKPALLQQIDAEIEKVSLFYHTYISSHYTCFL